MNLHGLLCFSPEEGGGDNGDDDAGIKSGGTDDAGSGNGSDNKGSGSNDEQAIARAEYNARAKKREKKVDVLSERMDGIETKLGGLLEKLSEITAVAADEAEKKKGGRPKGEDTKISEALEGIAFKMDASLTNIHERLDAAEAKDAQRHEADSRRDLLSTAGATPDFIRAVDTGIINIPKDVMEDFDQVSAFIGRFGGFPAEDGAGDPPPTTSTRQRSVPLRDGDAGTGTVHADRKTRIGVDETIEALEKEVNETFDKIEGVPSVSDLTKIMKLTDQLEDTLAEPSSRTNI